MKKTILVLFAVIVMAASALHAQSMLVRATIPFDFVVGHSALHAGEYTIHPISGDRGAVLLRSADLKNSIVISPSTYTSGATKANSQLVFKVIGGRYYLWQIWTAGYDTGRELSIEPQHNETAHASPTQTVALKVVLAKP